MSRKRTTEQFVQDLKDWFGRRCREAELRGSAKDVDDEIKQIFSELDGKLRKAQEDPELPSIKVGMTSVGIESDAGEPTHITVILENGVSVNWRVPSDDYGVIKLEYTPTSPSNRWDTIGKTKDEKPISPYKKEQQPKDRKHSRFDKLSRHLSKKLPVEK